MAHFDDVRTLDVRLTKPEIRRRRDELTADERITLRKNPSDWLELTVGSDEDVDWAVTVVLAAVHANPPTPAGGVRAT